MIAAARWFRPIGPVLITVTTCLVIALGWFGAYSAIVAHRAVSRARVETEVHSKAALIAEQLRRELLVTDQTLHILELEWERDPARFDFESWRQRALALSDISRLPEVMVVRSWFEAGLQRSLIGYSRSNVVRWYPERELGAWKPARHRRSCLCSGVLRQRHVRTAVIIVGKAQRQHSPVICPLLRKRIRQPGHAAILHSQRQVAPLDMAG